MMTIRVMLCDDHTIVRDGLHNLLEAEADGEVVGQASDGQQALTLIEELTKAQMSCCWISTCQPLAAWKRWSG